MVELKGIESLKAEVTLMTTVVGIVMQAKADGSVNAADLALLLNLVPVLPAAATGLPEVLPELKDLSADEGKELIAFTMGKLTLGSGKAGLIVEKSLLAALALYELEKAITAPEVVVPVAEPVAQVA